MWAYIIPIVLVILGIAICVAIMSRRNAQMNHQMAIMQSQGQYGNTMGNNPNNPVAIPLLKPSFALSPASPGTRSCPNLTSPSTQITRALRMDSRMGSRRRMGSSTGSSTGSSREAWALERHWRWVSVVVSSEDGPLAVRWTVADMAAAATAATWLVTSGCDSLSALRSL
jgi:hypothetical protein